MQRNTLPVMESTPSSSNKFYNYFTRKFRSSNHSLKRAKSTTKLDSRKRSLLDIRTPSPDFNASSVDPDTFDFSQSDSIEIRSLPNGVVGCTSQHCFQILAAGRPPMLFSCRSAEDRQNWIESIRLSIEAKQEKSVRIDNTISIQISEAKNLPTKKCWYHNEIYIDGAIYGETSKISSSAMLFWGEEFKYNNLPSISSLKIKLFKETASKRRNKKEISKQLHGVVEIPIETTNQTIEKWFPIMLSDSAEGHLRVKVRYQTTKILAMHRYTEFTDYLCAEFQPLVTCMDGLVSVKVKEEISTCMVRITQKLGFPADYLSSIVIAEIEKIGTDNENTAFRGNSIATKSMESYMKLVSKSYLKNTLADFIRYMYSPSAQDCEVDDTKLNANQELETQQLNLVYCCTMVWRNIINSHSYFPIELSKVFSRIKLHFTSNDLSYHLLSACIFLRLLCPAILAPNLFGLAKCLPLGKSSRNLTLVTKTIQTLANFTKFGSKESYMTFMNGFLDKEQRNMQEFIENISYCDAEYRTEYDGYIDLGRELSVLSNILHETLQQHPNIKMDKLRNILDKLQSTNEIHTPAPPHHGSYQHLPNLRKHHKKHYTGTVPVQRRVITNLNISDNESLNSSINKVFSSENNLSHAYDRHSQYYEHVERVTPLTDLVTFLEAPMSRSESTADIVNGRDSVDEVQFIDHEHNNRGQEISSPRKIPPSRPPSLSTVAPPPSKQPDLNTSKGHSITSTPQSIHESTKLFAQRLALHLAEAVKQDNSNPNGSSPNLTYSSKNTSTQVSNSSSNQNLTQSSYPTLNGTRMGISSFQQKTSTELSNELNKLRRNLWNTQQAYEVERVKCQKLRHELQTHDKLKNSLVVAEQRCKDQCHQIKLLQAANTRLIASIKINKCETILHHSQEDIQMLKSSSC